MHSYNRHNSTFYLFNSPQLIIINLNFNMLEGENVTLTIT